MKQPISADTKERTEYFFHIPINICQIIQMILLSFLFGGVLCRTYLQLNLPTGNGELSGLVKGVCVSKKNRERRNEKEKKAEEERAENIWVSPSFPTLCPYFPP